ncbi:hypothetical protein CL617_03245 [archaeon]|nr:hypothetical protein [archaeon]|tara:strand:- start:3716 stop:4684 length:969 start_codon:yes stop_codon:yes gene_type:complete
MEKRFRFYTSLSRIIPLKYRELFSELLTYAGESRYSAEHYIGSTLFLSLLLFVIFVLANWSLYGKFGGVFLIYGILAFIVVQFIAYLLIFFKAEDRTRRIENYLPDFLQLMSANIRAGMTPFQALKVSARPEFGPLKEEIDKVTVKALGVGSFSDALININKRIKSDILSRVLKLFTSSMKSGGKLASLLEELSIDISQTNSLKKDLSTTTKSYVMFILFIVLIGMPMLLAISLHFLESVSAINISGDVGFGFSSLSSDGGITVSFLSNISAVVLIVTSILSSGLIGVIGAGKIQSGLRYSIFVILGSFVIFHIGRLLVSNF